LLGPSFINLPAIAVRYTLSTYGICCTLVDKSNWYHWADALNAKEMNINPGGQQRHMHSTIIPHDNPDPNLCGQVQDMVFPTDLPSTHPHYAFCRKPKGMRVVLQERNLWDTLKALNGGKDIVGECSSCKLSQKACAALARGSAAQSIFDNAEDEDSPPDDAISPSRSKTCCMQMVLSHQANFLAEKPRLQTVIEAAGHKCYFLPKFHCELNPIEMYWGWVKIREHLVHSISFESLISILRLHALADGTFPTAKRLVPELLDSCPTNVIRAFY
jgi:hypothetical protein